MKAWFTPVIVGFSVSLAGTISAQTSERSIMAPHSAEGDLIQRIAERNQLGLAQYCQKEGFITQAVVEQLRGIVASSTPVREDQLGAAEEALGQDGVIAVDRSRTSFLTDAAAQGIKISYSCFQLAVRVAGQAKDLK